METASTEMKIILYILEANLQTSFRHSCKEQSDWPDKKCSKC